MTPLLVKVCGMTQADNICRVAQLGVDLIGFIFYPPSPRFLCQVPTPLSTGDARRVGVFVDQSPDTILDHVSRYGLHYVQLHGHESPHYCRALQAAGVRLIKAFSIAHHHDLAAVEAYNGLCHYYLFDTPSPQHGGSGRSFDWHLLHHYHGPTPFLLSGGIGAHSCDNLAQFHHPQLAGIDLNSRFETAPGVKDVAQLEAFLHQFNHQPLKID